MSSSIQTNGKRITKLPAPYSVPAGGDVGAHPKSAQRGSIIPGRSNKKETQSQVANCEAEGEAKLLDSYDISC